MSAEDSLQEVATDSRLWSKMYNLLMGQEAFRMGS